MDAKNKQRLPDPNNRELVQHVTEAHKILSGLQPQVNQHPAFNEAVREAIQRLEMALALLSVKTGGMF